MTLSPRVELARRAKLDSVNDFFGGWVEEDIAALQRWRCDLQGIEPAPGELVDWLGCRTAKANHAWLGNSQAGAVVDDLPFPDDQIHAEAIEYVALIFAIERALADAQTTFRVIELGSSYAPWCVSAAVTARRAGLTVTADAVEANESTMPLIGEHFQRNGIHADPQVTFHAHNAAVSTSGEDLYFPVVDTRSDNGAQATQTPSSQDYRGVSQSYRRVPGLTLQGLLGPSPDSVDFLHMDLQGAEQGLLEDDEFLRTISSHVRVLFLATQSRLIEGIALRELSKRGWTLYRERPTMFIAKPETRDVNGWTVRDGGQVWFNQDLTQPGTGQARSR